MFARVTLEAVWLVERVDLLLRLGCALAVHIALLFQMPDLPSAANEVHHTLLADEEEDDSKDKQRKDVLTPFAYLDRCPEFRKSHAIYDLVIYDLLIFAAKIHFFLHISKFFCTFVADLIKRHMKTRFGLLAVALITALTMVAQTHITVDNPATWSGEVLRPYIGQTVIFDVPMVVCGNANGSYTVSPWRRFQPESKGSVGTADYKETSRINSSCMFRIDNISGYHRCGEQIIGLQARVNSTSSLTWVSGSWSGNTRAELQAGLPDLGDYRLLVCGFNLENYYMTWGSMGASSYEEHQKQRKKIRNALVRINADLYGLVELQQGNEAIDEIMQDLNARLPERNYKHFNDGAAGTFQKVDYLYDANKVAPISNVPAKTDVEVQNRKKIMCFSEIATGEKFSYSINHFKAMTGGGEERRVNEAKAVLELYKSYRSNKNVRDKDVLIMGDLNCYAFTAPIKQLTENGMIDLHRAFHADSSYSYMFSGLASYIDHALCNETMFRQITGMSGFHINSDEDDKYTYDKSSDNSMFRCSDHDPVLVGLKLDSMLSHEIEPYINNASILFGESKKMIIQDAYQPDSKSYYAIYDINGMLIERKEIESAYHTVDIPSQAGVYIVYIYYKGEVHRERLIVK